MAWQKGLAVLVILSMSILTERHSPRYTPKTSKTKATIQREMALMPSINQDWRKWHSKQLTFLRLVLERETRAGSWCKSDDFVSIFRTFTIKISSVRSEAASIDKVGLLSAIPCIEYSELRNSFWIPDDARSRLWPRPGGASWAWWHNSCYNQTSVILMASILPLLMNDADLKKIGEYENTLIVVTADHGHGFVCHPLQAFTSILS